VIRSDPPSSRAPAAFFNQHRDIHAERLIQQHALQKLQGAARKYDSPAVKYFLHGMLEDNAGVVNPHHP
jgi:hypothetical protein